VKAGCRRTVRDVANDFKGMDSRSSRLWRRREGTSRIDSLSQSCTSPRTCNGLGDVFSPPSCCKGQEKPSHEATCSL